MIDNRLISRRTVLAGLGGFAAYARSVAKFEQVDIFQQGDAGVHTYRIPALLQTRKGRLLAVVDARHESDRDLPAPISLVMRTSSNRGRTWSNAVTIRKVANGGVGDASLLLDKRTGRVWCFHNYGPPGIGFFTAKAGARSGPATLQFHAMFSDDDGATWSEPRDLTPQVKDPAWQAMLAVSGTDIQTSGYRYLVPTVVRDERGVTSARNAYSDDGGETWKIGPAIGPGSDESHCVELADGTILQNMRSGHTRAVARSADGGITFGPVTHDAALVDPVCNASITCYRRGGRDLLIFTNAASTKRENLTVKLSSDEGKTWTAGRTIHAGPAAYSTAIVLDDGSIGVLYERGETSSIEKITFARFDLRWAEAAVASVAPR
jgi:sialidase-1